MAIRGMNRRGDLSREALTGAFDLILAATLLLILLNIIGDIKSNDNIKKEFLSKDLALTINTVYASPQDVEVIYDPGAASISGFHYMFDGRVVVYEPDGIKASYPYAIGKGIETDFQNIENPSEIKIKKEGSSMQIGATLSDFSIQACPDVNTKARLSYQRIVIDPGHGGHDTGYVGIHHKEADAVMEAAKGIKGTEYTVLLTRRGDEYVPMQDRLSVAESGSMVISLHAGIDPNSYNNNVVIYYNDNSLRYQENRKIACIIHNNLIKEFSEITSIQMVGINAQTLGYQDPRKILSVSGHAPNVGAYIEFGNVNREGGMLDYSPSGGAAGIGRFTTTLIKSFEEYYG